MKNFTIDSITVKPLQTTYAPGVDYMADYDEWLFIQVRIHTYIYVYIEGSRKTWTTQMATCGGRPRWGFSSDVSLVGQYSDPRINTTFKHSLCAPSLYEGKQETIEGGPTLRRVVTSMVNLYVYRA